MVVSEGAGRRALDLRAVWRSAADAAPACLTAAGAVLGLATAQGGYFATTWGWASTALLWIIGLWAALTGRTTSPGIFDVLELLGREESLGRLDDRLP